MPRPAPPRPAPPRPAPPRPAPPRPAHLSVETGDGDEEEAEEDDGVADAVPQHEGGAGRLDARAVHDVAVVVVVCVVHLKVQEIQELRMYTEVHRGTPRYRDVWCTWRYNLEVQERLVHLKVQEVQMSRKVQGRTVHLEVQEVQLYTEL